MPYKITVDDNDSIVIAKVTDKVKFEVHIEALEKSLQLCSKKNIKRLLVDLRELDIKDVVSTSEAYKFGKTLATDNRLKGIYLAHVLPILPQSRRDVELLSTVAANRGVMSKEFTNLKEAKKWLLSYK